NQHYRIVYKDDIGGYLLYPICSMNGSRRVIGKASSGAGQVVLKNYSSTSMDKVDITYAGTGASYTVKCGSYAMADSESSVVYSSYSSSATNQKWTFTADYSRIRDELQFSGIDIVFPVGGDPSITSGYGFREYTGYSFHDGVDIGVYNVGLKAPFDGTIVFVGTNSSDERGLYIVLKSNEYSNLYTHFYHLSSIDVIENQVVSKGETIGLTGSTGWGSGAHLHLIFSASSGNGPNNYIHTFDPLWFYPNIQFSRNDSTDSIIGGIRQ
ncbi:MAG: M23 family metallopeptidase, partial [Clostridiales bacterium]|nr:M23 family metallopeptidase [Clostridiales bacterium]